MNDLDEESDLYEGSCLCGALRFHIVGSLASSRNCFCENCRKFAGTSPAVWAMAKTTDLSVLTPEASISRYDSGQGIRCFCTSCGSPVWFESKDYPAITGIPLGALDGGDAPPPEMNLWTDSKPPWCTIDSSLNSFTNGPDE